MNNFSDFITVNDLKFDISKLQEGLKQVLSIKSYDTANGIKNFSAICLNQIPGKPESTKGNYARGVYWTKPDDTGKEAVRDKILDETLYTEFVKDFEHTYFRTVYEKLKSNYMVSTYINSLYFLAIIPGIVFMKNGFFCKYYFLFVLILYIFFYKTLYAKMNKY